MKKNDWILIICVIVIAGICFFGNRILASKYLEEKESVTITVAGEQFGTYLLSTSKEIDINGTNKVVIKDGAADMVEATCPDKTCVHQKSISKSTQRIVCLPNKVVLEVVSKEKAKEDIVVG